MGLWNWLWETLTGDSPSAPREPGGYRSATFSTPARTATLTLERGHGHSTVEEEPAASPTALEAPAPPVQDAVAPLWWAPAGVTAIDPVPPERPNLSVEARALETRLISHFDGHDLAMPPMPQVAEKVLKRLRDRKAGAAHIAQDLAEDPVTAANVLRLANSALYRGVEKITSMPVAVTRLGSNAIRTLMMHQSVRAAVFQGKGVLAEFAELVWGNALAAGCVMREIAPFVHDDPDEAFLVGLLHDIGNVLVLRLAQEQQKFTRWSIEAPTFDYLCMETHQELGELIADAWQLAPKLRSLISDHHEFPRPDDPLARDRWTLMATDMICQMLGYAPPGQYDLLNSRPIVELGLASRPGFRDMLAWLPEKIESNLAELRG